jgi:hypothetical protein
MTLLRKVFSLSTLTLLIALSLSGIAAWYSIIGLTAIFAAAAVPVIIMGAALETAKVVTTMWLHKFWNGSGLLLKLYLIPAVVVLALITSMGIFGFLSKAHLEQAKPAGNNVAKIERIDLQITREKRTIQDSEKIIAQLDQTVQVLMDNQRIRGPDGALAVRKSQQAERDNLSSTINAAQEQVDKLEDEKFELNIAVRDLQLEVGPIKYVASLIYEDAESNLENAVRIVILLLVVVFDPLALCLVIASLKAREIEYAELERKALEKKEAKLEASVLPESLPEVQNCFKCGTELLDAPGIGLFCPNKECDVFDGPLEPEEIIEEEPLEHTKCGTPECCGTCDTAEITDTDHQDEPNKEGGVIQFYPEEEVKKKELPAEEVYIEPTTFSIEATEPTKLIEDNKPTFQEIDGGYIIYEDKLVKKEALKEMRPDLFVVRADSQAINTSFGTQFPKTAHKGDTFVRVDILPNKVFKFDGARWIEINKLNTDSYLFDREYIKYLIDKLSNGEYDIELLSDNERFQIEEYLKASGQ